MSTSAVPNLTSRWRIAAGLLAVLAVLAAALFARAPRADASFSGGSLTFQVVPAGQPPVGSITTFTAQLSLSSATSGTVSMRLPAVPGLIPFELTVPGGFTCPWPLADNAITGSECTSAAPLGAGNYLFMLRGIATGPGTVLGPMIWTAVDNGDQSQLAGASSGVFNFSTSTGATASPTAITVPLGALVPISFSVPAGSTCQSDSDPTPDIDIECSAADLYNPDSLVVNKAPTQTLGDNDTATASAVTAAVVASKPGTHIVALRLKQWGPEEPVGIVTAQGAQQQLPFDSVYNYVSYPVEITVITPELRHMADTQPPLAIYTGETFGGQDVQNNVRGSRHIVCAVQADTGTVTTPFAVAATIPLTLPNTQISVTNGGGYNGAEVVTQPQSPTFTDVQIFTGNGLRIGSIENGIPGNGGLDGATCFSWVSTGAGDQEISVNFLSSDGVTPVHVDWDTNANGNGEGAVRLNRALIKEWNVLEDSTVTLTGGATGTATGDSTTTPVLTSNINLVLNPAWGYYQTPNGLPITISDVFNGSHVTRANTVVRTSLAGVIWTVNWSGCGVLYDDLLSGSIENVTTSLTVAALGAISDGDVIKVGSEYMLVTLESGASLTVVRGVSATGTAGGSTAVSHDSGSPALIVQGTTKLTHFGTVTLKPAPKFDPSGGPSPCSPGAAVDVTFTGREPGPLGSGPGLTVTETVRLTFTTTVTQKKVFLAWAGNRVILEADWRIPPGDSAGFEQSGFIFIQGVPVGTCPYPDGTAIRYIKGSGPGNFLSGLGAAISNADEATVFLGSGMAFANANGGIDYADNSQTLDAPIRPQGACISRVLFESEDPGQVDIEAFTADEPLRVQPGSASAEFDSVSANQIASVNVTKRAFVIYYMKFESVTVSFVDDVSKGINHNSPILTDFTPGNPWDATKDVSTVDWNVSKDLLVRGRVKGWFVNANPSGRPASTADPLNILPENRWVLPDDWALLAGGPADNANNSTASGTAEEFRPYYDIMIDPGQNRFALANTFGFGIRVTSLVDWPATASPAGSNTTTTLAVANSNSSSGIKAGVFVIIGVGTVTTTRPNIALQGGSFVASTGTIVNSAGDVVGYTITLSTPLQAVPAAGAPVTIFSPADFIGPYSLIDICTPSPAYNDCSAGSNPPTFVAGAATSSAGTPLRDTALRDGDVDKWDAPMPVAMMSVNLRGTGFIKEVFKGDVYYTGSQNGTAFVFGGDQFFPNPFYASEIPDSPYIPAVVSGGGYLWDSWGMDGAAAMDNGPHGMGAYVFWDAVRIGTNSAGIGDALNTEDLVELADIRSAYGDPSIARDLVVYSDNHGEFMVIANGDFKTDLTACAANTLGGGKHCKTGDAVGKGTLTATADYPDFRGKHFPVKSNDAVVTWTWGGYKDVTIENDPAGNSQYKYVVFHAMDRDGFCRPTPNTGMVLLHSVLTATDAATKITNYPTRGAKDPDETIDFLIDSGEGIILTSNAVPSAPALPTGVLNNGKQFIEGVKTFSIEENDPALTGILEFPKSSLAATAATDECQAWIKVSNSLLGVIDVLVIAHDDEGDIAFDEIIDLQDTATFTLNFRWSLITWTGADDIPVSDAVKGTGANDAGNDISDQVTAIYGWDAPAQDWLGYFPSGVNVPGANDLVKLDQGAAYWVAIKGPGAVTWTIATDVDQ